MNFIYTWQNLNLLLMIVYLQESASQSRDGQIEKYLELNEALFTWLFRHQLSSSCEEFCGNKHEEGSNLLK